MPKKKEGWQPGDEPTSELARLIINSWFNDDFVLAIIYGTPRVGKSSYALKVMIQVYDYLFGWDMWKVYDKCIGWKPEDVIQDWSMILDKIPAYCWDDAGCWLFTLNWNDPLLQEVQRYMNVVGTDIQCLILTTPTPEWILSKVGAMPGAYWVKITKRDGGGTKYLGRLPDSKRYARLATAYWPFKTPDLKSRRVRKRFYDEFSCKLPQELYETYNPTRMKYASLVRLEMKKAMLKKLGKATEADISTIDQRIAEVMGNE